MNNNVKNVLADRESRLKITKPLLTNLIDVKTEEVEWLWRDRIPLGKLTLVEGDPGVGKSWITMALVSAVTTGAPLPEDEREREPKSSLILSAEDGLGDTVKPRLEGMGAKIENVKVLEGVKRDGKDGHFSLTDDIKVLEKVLFDNDYGIVVIDPLNAYLSGVDSHKDTDLRSALMPLAKLAAKYQVAVVCVRHLTKSGKDRAIYRGQGSIAYTAAARVVHLVGLDPNDPTKRVIVPIKNNLAPLVSGIEYSIDASSFTWGRVTELTADSLLAPSDEDLGSSAIDEAKDFILSKLATTGECLATVIINEAKALGISERTLKRAKAGLVGFVETGKRGFGQEGQWVWKLTDLPKDANSSTKESGTLSSNSLI